MTPWPLTNIVRPQVRGFKNQTYPSEMPSISQTTEHDCYDCDIFNLQLLFQEAEEGSIHDKPEETVLRDIMGFAQERGIEESDILFSCAKFYYDCEKFMGEENVVPCWGTFKNSKECKDLGECASDIPTGFGRFFQVPN
jgi:hypothetical protein